MSLTLTPRGEITAGIVQLDTPQCPLTLKISNLSGRLTWILEVEK